MNVEVRLFGGLAARVGANRVTVRLEGEPTVSRLRAAVAEQLPVIGPLLDKVQVAVDLEVAGPDHRIGADSEVALLPPVAGGSGGGGLPAVREHRGRAVVTGLMDPPLPVEPVVAAVAGPDVGGTAIFLGTVRDHAEDLDGVVGLDYSAYREMAEKVLDDIAGRILDDHPRVRGIALLHALGELSVGTHTILIVATAANRDPAFEACRDALERVKDQTPVFKREHTADGATRWVGLDDPDPDSDGP